MKKRHFITPEKTRKSNADWRKRNPEKMLGYQVKWARNNPEGRMVISARNRAKRKDLEFTITKDDFVVPTYCPVLGIELKSGIGESGKPGGNWNSPSLDRIDSSKGYVPGNIQVMSFLANTMKGSATPEQLLKFAKWVNTTYG